MKTLYPCLLLSLGLAARLHVLGAPNLDRRFFADESLWNQPIPPNPKIDPQSAAWIDLLRHEPAGPYFGENADKYAVPAYDADASAPRYRIHHRPVGAKFKRMHDPGNASFTTSAFDTEGLYGHPGESWQGKIRDWRDGFIRIPIPHYRVLDVATLNQGGLDSRELNRVYFQTERQVRPGDSVVPPAVRNAILDAFVPSDRAAGACAGYLGERMRINIEKRLLAIDLDTILGPFEKRGAGQWWLGEHAGKFIHAGTLAWRSSGDERLKRRVAEAVKRLVRAQLPNGYLGTYPEKDRLVEGDGVSWDGPVWDVWAHKYGLIGLLTYYQATGDNPALAASRRAADLLCETFGPGKKSLVRASSHVGMASTSVLEPMAVLYRLTGEKRYLDFCHHILDAWEQPPASKILTSLLEHGSVYRTANNKAYEMLSNLVGLMELYRLEGDARYLRACQAGWDDVFNRRLYPIGTTSYAEHFTDDFALPLGPLGDEKESKIGEGCVTVTWLQLTLQLFQVTGSPKYADALERTLYNALPGAQSPHTGQVCYFIPLNGHRRFGEVSHGLLPDISCCSSSIPRGLALIPECVCGALNGAPAIVQYEPGTYRVMADLEGATAPIELRIGAGYPEREQFTIEVRPPKAARFALLLRVPTWAESFVARVGDSQFKGEAGAMLRLEREWAPGDTVHVSLPMTVQTHRDPDRSSKKVWRSRGPQVLATDREIKGRDLPGGWWGKQLYRVTDKKNQEELALVPFAEAGQRKETYTTLMEDFELAPTQ